MKDRHVDFREELPRVGIREVEEKTERGVDTGPPVCVEEQPLVRDGAWIAEDRDRLNALPFQFGDKRVEGLGFAAVKGRFEEADGDPGSAGMTFAVRQSGACANSPAMRSARYRCSWTVSLTQPCRVTATT